MKNIFFIVFGLWMLEGWAEPYLKNIEETTKEDIDGNTIYTFTTEITPKHPTKIQVKLKFLANGEQPSSAEVGMFVTSSTPVLQEYYISAWRTFFKLLDIFEGGIPECFNELTLNPIARALLYRISIELLRVKKEGKEEVACFQNGEPRVGTWSKKIKWDIEKLKKESPYSSLEESLGVYLHNTDCCFLFYKLLRYFHELQPSRNNKILIDMLNTGSDTPLSLSEENLPFLVDYFGFINQDFSDNKNYYPGDDLSFNAYFQSLNYLLPQDKVILSFQILKSCLKKAQIGDQEFIKNKLILHDNNCFWNYVSFSEICPLQGHSFYLSFEGDQGIDWLSMWEDGVNAIHAQINKTIKEWYDKFSLGNPKSLVSCLQQKQPIYYEFHIQIKNRYLRHGKISFWASEISSLDKQDTPAYCRLHIFLKSLLESSEPKNPPKRALLSNKDN